MCAYNYNIIKRHQTDFYTLDLLPGIVPHSRVLTFGYDTNIRHSLNGPISQNRLGDHATDFLSALENCRSNDTRRPLIFVAHSLGGLLVKDTLRLSKSYEHAQPERYDIYQSTTNLCFFGTPHAGADPRNTLHKVLTTIINVLGFRVNKEIVQTLMPGAERSKLLEEDFLKWTNERNWGIYTFQEELAHSALGAKIVDDHSSSINDPRHERIVHIRADHVDMCRFTSADDLEFKKVSSAILRAQERLLQTNVPSPLNSDKYQGHASPQTTDVMLSSGQIDGILEKLSFQGIDARYMTLKTAQRKTCKWLLKHHSYKSWVDSSQTDAHHGFLWIKGKPGTGKSISMKYLYQNAVSSKNDRLVLKFFFNARGTKLEHSTEGMYRSVLWQLIRALPVSSIKSKVLGQLCTLDDATPWPIEALKEAFSSVLTDASSHEVYCFVDALDECAEEEIRNMISFFEDIGERTVLGQFKIRVCFSSRHYPHITIHCGLQLVLEDEDDHSNDIRQYIHSQLRIDHNQLRQGIEDEIFDRSSRIFLWAALVVDILNKENDKGGDVSVRKRLSQIPQGLHDLFQDILTRDNENMEEMILCIQCILFSKRPLRPEELYFALQIGINTEVSMVWNQTSAPIERINRFNLNASKGLAEVTKKDTTVQFIHESVRDYLLRERGLETLIHSQQLRTNFSGGVSHDILRDICLKQILGGHVALESTENGSSWSGIPFLQYAVTYILAHADSAQSLGSGQSDFLLNIFPREAWVNLDNKLQKHKIRHHTNEVELLYLLAEQNLANLIHIHPQRHSAFLELKKTERFPSPLIAAAVFGNNEAVFALAFEAAAGVLAPSRQQDLNEVEKELRKMPRFKSELSVQKRNPMDTFSLFCALGSITLVDALWDQILATTNVKPKESLGRVRRLTSLDIDIYLIKKGAEVDTITYGSRTVLMKAVEANALETAEFLLAKGADPYMDSIMPLGAATCLGCANSSAMVRLLIRHGFNTIPNLLSALSELPDDELHGFLKHIVTSMSLLRRILNIDDTLLDLKDGKGEPSLIKAVLINNFEAVKLLCEVGGADINTQDDLGRTPVAAAASYGRCAMLQYLLESGADPNIKDNNGDSALAISTRRFGMQSVDDFALDVLKALLRCPSLDVNITDNIGLNPLLTAVKEESFLTAQLLLSYSTIDVNFQTPAGINSLLVAVGRGNLEIVQLLLSHPYIDINLPDSFGMTPLLSAANSASLGLVWLLLNDPRTDRTLKCMAGKSVLDYAKRNPDPEVFKLVEEIQ
ncbi:ankyrin [Ustulina deusta]|nr:ankyrin [Ustulina deusta]